MTTFVIRPEKLQCPCGAWFPPRPEGRGMQARFCPECRRKSKATKRHRLNQLERARADAKLQALEELAKLEADVRALVEKQWEGQAVLELIREARRRVAS